MTVNEKVVDETTANKTIVDKREILCNDCDTGANERTPIKRIGKHASRLHRILPSLSQIVTDNDV